MRYIKLLIGFLFLSSLTFAQKQTYGNFRAKTDKFFQDQFKKNPDDESLLKQYKYYNRTTWFWDTRVSHEGLSDDYFLNLTNFIRENNSIKQYFPYSKSLHDDKFWEIIGPNVYPVDTIPIHSTNSYNVKESGIGRIDAIWVDPSDNDHLLIGAYGGGLWETTNGGVNWNCLTEGLHTLSVHEIEVIDGVIYLACGFDFGNRSFSNAHFGNKYGLGVIKSSDWGTTWTLPETNFSSKALDYYKGNPDIMYSVDPRHVYKSIDRGNSWVKLPHTFFPYIDHNDPTLNDIIIHPTNPSIVFLVGERGDGSTIVFKTTNGGTTWSNLSLFNTLPGFPSHKVIGGSFDYNTTTNKLYLNLLYAIYQSSWQNTSRRSVIFESSDWNIWSALPGSNSTNYQSYADIKTNLNGSKIYQLSINLFDRTAGGNINLSFGGGSYKMHDDIRALSFGSNNSIMFAGHDGGISKSTDAGLTWQHINGDLNLNLSFEMGYYSDLNGPGDRLYDIGTQDTGWYRNKMDGSPRYKTRDHEGSVYTSPHTGRIYYKHASYGVQISDDGGGTRPYLKNGTNNITQADFTSALLEDPVDSEIIYINNGVALIKNSDFGTHPTVWDNITPENYNDQRSFAIGIPHSNNNVIYYVTTVVGSTVPDNVIWKSEDQGGSWCNITNNLTPYFQGESIRITSINSDSFNPNRVWITIGGISQDGSHVYYSSNGGQSWANITHNLPNLPVNTVEYDENRKTVFIGTDYGVYYLDGSTWREYGNDLPKAIVTNVFIDDLYNEIVVSTFGRGAWKAPLDICSDRVIYENTTLSGNQKICGDLIVKAGKTLTLNSSNLIVQNIIIEPGAKIIWNGGSLNIAESGGIGVGTKVGKGVCALYNGSLLRLNGVTINNYEVQARQMSTISMNTTSLINSSLNFNETSYFHLLQGTTLNINVNSSVNLNEGFNFGYHSSLALANTYVTSFTGIGTLMGGTGYVNSYTDNLQLSQTFSAGNYNFYANNNITVGLNAVGGTLSNFIVQNNVNMKLEAGESILIDVGSEIKNKNFLAQINTKLAETPICHESLPPSGSSIIKEDKENNKQENNYLHDNLKKTITIYPNPSNGLFKYKLEHIQIEREYKITIYDLNGQSIKSFTAKENEGEIDLSRYKSGTYALVLEIENNTERILLIKK